MAYDSVSIKFLLVGINMRQDVLHISLYIDCPVAQVYDFASDPGNLPRWAAGLARSDIYKQGDVWIAEAPFGNVKIKFSPRNDFGVMDHDVELDSGLVVHNPMRVLPNGEGSEFVFTLLRQPNMSDAQFEDDKRSVEKDLLTLKTLLEGSI